MASSCSVVTKRSLFCVVCLEEVAVDPVVTDCGHLYCTLCLSRWLERKDTCPICSARVPDLGELRRRGRRRETSSEKKKFSRQSFFDLPFPSLFALQFRPSRDADKKYKVRWWPRIVSATIFIAFLLI